MSKRSSSAALAPHLILQEGLTNEEGLTNAHASRVEVESPTGTGQETQRSASEQRMTTFPGVQERALLYSASTGASVRASS